MTLREYLEDYASPRTKVLGEQMIARSIPMIPSEHVRRITTERLKDIVAGKRDFRF